MSFLGMGVTAITQPIKLALQEAGWTAKALGVKVNDQDQVTMFRLPVEKDGLKLDLQAVVQEDPDLPIYVGAVTMTEDFDDTTFDDIDSVQSSPEAVLVHLIKQLP